MSKIRILLLLALLLVGIAAPAAAANRYLKADCPLNGNGSAPTCALSAGASGAWNSVDNVNAGWPSVCAPEDVLFVRAKTDDSETMASSNNDDRRWHGGLRAACSGTLGHLVTIAPYPGELARITNGPVGCNATTCDNATITTGERSFVRIGPVDGLYGAVGRLIVRGAIMAHGTGAQPGVVIAGNEITGGWEDAGDGNWAGIRVEDITAPLIRNNFIHDIIMTAGATNASSGTGIKIYRSPGTIAEFNRVLRACNTTNCGPDGVFESQAGGIDDKDGSVNNTHRFNYMSQVPVCIRFQNQGVTATGSQAYGNVCDRGAVSDSGGHGAIVTEAGPINDIVVRSNTVHGWGLGVSVKSAFNGSGGFTLRDNIFAAVAGGNPADRNIFDDGSSFALADLATATNFNAYDANGGYQVDSNSNDIAAWRVVSGRDANSHEEAGGCAFIAGTDTNFHLPAGICKTSSSTGGEQGAYGVTSCVGHLCSGGSSSSTPPAAPGPVVVP